MDKKELRRYIAARKKEMTLAERESRSGAVWERVRRIPEFRQAGRVLLYWSLPDEVFTHRFVQETALEKQVFLPVVQGEDLVIRPFSGVGNLVPGDSFAIPEPAAGAGEVLLETLDLVIVPGVAFDALGGRTGRGKGFYDRLFAGARRLPCRIGVCFDCQLVERVPCDPHDVPMDYVVWESGQASLRGME